MKKEKFDFVFSIGAACSCSVMLRELGLQYASFPLDWTGNATAGSREGMRRATESIVGGFANWLKEENLVRSPENDSKQHLAFFDNGPGLFFAHEFPLGEDFHAVYPAVVEKYARRMARLRKLLLSSRKVLVVWVSDPRAEGDVTESDIRQCLSALGKAYPKAEFRMFAANCAPGVNPESMQVLEGDGFVCCAFDYRALTDGSPVWGIRNELFKPLMDRYEAVDYRTRAEKRENARRRRARDMVKFKSTSTLDLFMTKLKFKLYRHLGRRLERKGVLPGKA